MGALWGMLPEELKAMMQSWGEPGFRGKQLFQDLQKGLDIDNMTVLPKALRERLKSEMPVPPVTVLEEHVSQEDGTIKTILDKNDIAQLGEGLRETGVICPEALERNAQSVAAFAKEAIENGAEKIVSVGTMALRTAKNSADFVARVKELCGVEVQVIPGEEEARLSYLAVLSGLPLEEGGELVIFDTGGGSTEFIFGQGTTLKNRFSVNLGALIITEKQYGRIQYILGTRSGDILDSDERFIEL